MAAGVVGTSTRVTGPVTYPPFWTVLVHLAWHMRGSVLAALLCVYGMCSDFGLPLVLRWVRSSSLVASALASEPAQWVQERVFDGRSDGKTLEDALVFVGMTMALHAVLYFGLNGFFLLCDVTGFLSRWKLPRTARMKIPAGRIRQTIVDAVVNQFVVGPFSIFGIYLALAHFKSAFAVPSDPAAPITNRPADATMLATPDLGTAVMHMALASLFNEVLFYIAHRAFHEVPGLYVRFHKKHHQYIGSIGFAAEHAHPLEQILANQGPTAFYMIAFSGTVGHPALWFTWIMWRMWETYEAHSGYCFTGSLPSAFGFTYGERAAFHDWHHSDNRGCYGVYWLDYLGGTMDSYAQLIARGFHKDHPGAKHHAPAAPAGPPTRAH
jgi:methylsterol monooxygenase